MQIYKSYILTLYIYLSCFTALSLSCPPLEEFLTEDNKKGSSLLVNSSVKVIKENNEELKIDPFEALHEALELKLNILSYLDVVDLLSCLSVNKAWNIVGEHEELWKSHFKNLALAEPFNPLELDVTWKQGVQLHFMLVASFINTLQGKTFTNQLTSISPIFKLKKKFIPIVEEYISFVINKRVINKGLNEVLARDNNETAIQCKMGGLLHGNYRYGYERNMEAFIIFNEELITRGSQKAVQRKIEGLSRGQYGYSIDFEALRKFNEELIEQGNVDALQRKIEGLRAGKYGYSKDFIALDKFKKDIIASKKYHFAIELIEKTDKEAIRWEIVRLREHDPEDSREFIEELIKKGSLDALNYKFEGFLWGRYGYTKDLEAAKQINEELIEKSYSPAIYRKREGLSIGNNIYEKSRDDALIAFNEKLISRGNKEAINDKVLDLAGERYSLSYNLYYKKDLNALREFNEKLVIQDDLEALERKIVGLSFGRYGYSQNLATARKLNDELVDQGDQKAIQRKVEGLSEGKYGYPKDVNGAMEYNESLIFQGDLEALKRKIECLDATKGKYGYPQDKDKARKLNDKLVSQGDLGAIHRKIEGLQCGKYGYKKNIKIAKKLNNNLARQGDERARRRRGDIHKAARERENENENKEQLLALFRDFNEELIAINNSKAIYRKIYGLQNGEDGYPKDLNALRELIEELISQGNKEGIHLKIQALVKDGFGYKPDFNEARRLNEELAQQNNLRAVERKFIGLANGSYGYKRDLKASEETKKLLEELNEVLIAQKDQEAIKRKLRGLIKGDHGYCKDITAAREFNEALIRQFDQDAIHRKIEDLMRVEVFINSYYHNVNSIFWRDGHIFYWEGYDLDEINETREYPYRCYEKDIEAGKALNETLALKGDPKAIKRKLKNLKDSKEFIEVNENLVSQNNIKALHYKIVGLAEGRYGYKKNLDEAKRLNEELVQQGDVRAINRKVIALAFGDYIYKKDIKAAQELNEILILRNDPKAIARKINLLYEAACDCDLDYYRINFKYGYKKYFNEKLIAKNYFPAIELKINGLAKGRYGYKKDFMAARGFIEELIMRGNPEAISLKIDFLRADDCPDGFSMRIYEKNLEALREFNEELIMRGDRRAIHRKIEENNFRSYHDENYEEETDEARRLNEELILQGDREALERKMNALKYGNSHIYSQDLDSLKEFNEILIQQHNVNSLIQKIIGLAYGLYGYEVSRDAAVEFAKKHRIHPYSLAEVL